MNAQARISLPDWPRLLSEGEAARYLGLSPTNFRARWEAKSFPQPHRIGKRLLWDKRLLDRYVDALSGLGTASNSWDDL